MLIELDLEFITVGRKKCGSDGSTEEKPQLLFIKIVPSPSVILT